MSTTAVTLPMARAVAGRCWRRARHTVRPGVLALAVLAAGLGHVGTAVADMTVARPVAELFRAGGSTLSPAGERWLRGQVAHDARQPDSMVVVQVPGATPGLQRERAVAIRHRLAALGVAADKIYIEAGPVDDAAPRLAGR